MWIMILVRIIPGIHEAQFTHVLTLSPTDWMHLFCDSLYPYIARMKARTTRQYSMSWSSCLLRSMSGVYGSGCVWLRGMERWGLSVECYVWDELGAWVPHKCFRVVHISHCIPPCIPVWRDVPHLALNPAVANWLRGSKYWQLPPHSCRYLWISLSDRHSFSVLCGGGKEVWSSV